MAQPTIRVGLAISPAIFTFGDENCTLTITATLDYTHPITVYTWPSMFHLHLAQRRHNFFCVDLSDNDKALDLETENAGKRTPMFSLHIGCYDDQFLVTFYPGIPVTITGKFDLATRTWCETLQPGHRYRFGINPEGPGVGKWLHGTREEVMTKEHKLSRDHETSRIEIESCGDVEFEVAGDVTSPSSHTPVAED